VGLVWEETYFAEECYELSRIRDLVALGKKDMEEELFKTCSGHLFVSAALSSPINDAAKVSF
jgi:hypothetical protein